MRRVRIDSKNLMIIYLTIQPTPRRARCFQLSQIRCIRKIPARNRMDQDILSSDSHGESPSVAHPPHPFTVPGTSSPVLETLLQTNRPPTDEERETILDSMANIAAQSQAVEEQISEMTAQIAALHACVEQAEHRLQLLRDAEADHQRVFAPFRRLPEDVLRSIGVACVHGYIPKLSFGYRPPMPYILLQICSALRRVALATPRIWAAMSIEILRVPSELRDPYAVLGRRAIEWFGRAGALGLTVVVDDVINGRDPDESNVFFDALLSFSPRWREFRFMSFRRALAVPLIRVAALTPADVPQLQSVSLSCMRPIIHSVLRRSQFLLTSTLRHLECPSQMFPVNWAVLTSITLRWETANEIGQVLQQTKCLEFCDIIVHHLLDEHCAHSINLPFLKTLIFAEETRDMKDVPGSQLYSMLEAITAPILEIFTNDTHSCDLSLSDFLERSPHIRELYLLYSKQDNLFRTRWNFSATARHSPYSSFVPPGGS